MQRKIISFFTFLLVLALSIGFVGCKETRESTSIVRTEKQENLFAIYFEEAGEGEKLIDVMKSLKKKGELTYVLENGMLMEMNGKANAADFSACWMLYTTDEELSNSAWGTVEYDGKTLGSAMFGANDMPVVTGETYVWVYQIY